MVFLRFGICGLRLFFVFFAFLNYNPTGVKILIAMAKKKIQEVEKVDEEALDPKDEKMLDKVLMGVVIFVLGWLALGVLMAVGGLFGIWK